MARHDAGWWAERVAEFEKSGDAEGIARRGGVTVKLLKWWRWLLQQGPPAKTSAVRRRSPARTKERGPKLLPVVVAADVPAMKADDDANDTTIIETTRGRISVRGMLSAEQLAAVVAELVRGC